MEIASSCKNGASRNLETQQCRLRHLRGVSGRNFSHTLPESLVEASKSGAKLAFFFSLHIVESSEALYTSEMMCDISNLNWKSFNWSQFGDSINFSLPYIVVKLYAKLVDSETSASLLVSQYICFRTLRFLGEQIPKDDKQFPPNTLVFEMFEGFYSKFSDNPTNNDIPQKPVSRRFSSIEVPLGIERISYDLSTLKRVQMVQRAIRQTRASVMRVRRVIHDKLASTEETDRMRANCECITSRLSLLQDELDSQKQILQTVQKQCQELKRQNQDQGLELVKSRMILKKDEEALASEEMQLIVTKDSLSRRNGQLEFRQRQLFSELSYIYPIEEIGDNKFTICNVELPDSEDFNGRDEVMISVALGYVCHLVTMMTQFLHVPSRYPTLHQGTRSRIYDHFLSTITDNDREFPLYLRKKREDLRFKYGVYLLNKNISQLRVHCDLPTSDLRLTLHNLKAMLELRHTSRLDQSGSTPIDIERKSSLSIFKQIPRLSEEPSGSNDSLNLSASRLHGSPLRWHPSPKGILRPASLSLSLDHGLDEISSHLLGNGVAGHHPDTTTTAELSLSHPSLLDGVEQSGLLNPATERMLARTTPYRVYASESDEPAEEASEHLVSSAATTTT